MRIVETAAPGELLKEGLEYAHLGQTKRFAHSPGRIEAAIQGRESRAYTTVMRMSTFTPEHWDRVVVGLTEGAVYAAKLLAGEMPANIEDVFVPLGLKLFPSEPADIEVSCSCADYQSAAMRRAQADPESTDPLPSLWCKHVCCASYLFAEQLAAEPFLMFSLRGVDGQDLLERLRQRRAVVSAALGATPVYTQRITGVSDGDARPLEGDVAHFWECGPDIGDLDLPIEPPAVSHPLLRRLGPSPFANAPFPLVGLLASCYEAISEATLASKLISGSTPLDGLDDQTADDTDPDATPEEE